MNTESKENASFIFIFGYETPEEWSINESAGTDYASTGSFIVRAEGQSRALQWGSALADWYIMNLFGDKEPGRWKKAKFTYRIHRVGGAIDDGGFPDFDKVKQRLSTRGD